jgi:endo-1,4-beta-xylanase
VAITELDVRINETDLETGLGQQRGDYRNAVGAYVQVEGCVRVTVWDFYDPVRFPLLMGGKE